MRGQRAPLALPAGTKIDQSVANLSDSYNSSGTWTGKLEYNSQGLISRAYDARGVYADFSYDALNRLTLINYSDSTPDANYYYDSQTLPSGAPSYDHGYANGRLIAMTYGTSSSITGTYFGYDSMGRVDEQRQVTGANSYSLSYTYNLAGLLATETYPTGRVLTHSYDNGGRLSQIGDGATTFVSNFGFAPHGGLVSETWGNGAVHSMAYNSALQVSQVKLKQSSSGAELQRYDYLYGQVTQSSGAVDKSKNNGQIGRIDGIINGSSTKEWDQRFSYDELGRLSLAGRIPAGHRFHAKLEPDIHLRSFRQSLPVRQRQYPRLHARCVHGHRCGLKPFYHQRLNTRHIRRRLAMNKLRQNAKIDLGLPSLAKAVGSGASAIISVSGNFFGDAAFKVSKVGPTDPRQGRAQTILHEVAHALGLIPKDGKGYPADQAEKNDKTIMKHCGKGLGKL